MKKPSPRSSDLLNQSIPQPTHEPPSLSIKGVLWFSGTLVLLLILIALGLWGLLSIYETSFEGKAPVEEYIQAYRGAGDYVKHWSNPAIDLVEYEQIMEKRLHRYAWIDREQGIVQIPIERAMEIYAAQPLPDKENQETQE